MSKKKQQVRISTLVSLLLSSQTSYVCQEPDPELWQVVHVPCTPLLLPSSSQFPFIHTAYTCGFACYPWKYWQKFPKYLLIPDLCRPNMRVSNLASSHTLHWDRQQCDPNEQTYAGSWWLIDIYSVLSHRESPALEGYLLMKLASGFTWIC